MPPEPVPPPPAAECEHKWEIYKELDIYHIDEWDDEEKYVKGHQYHLKCEKCGEMMNEYFPNGR